MIKVVALSDTHGMMDKVKIPNGDVFIHAGDFTGRGSPQELFEFIAQINKLSHKYKIVVPGNHDTYCERDITLAKSVFNGYGIKLLIDDYIEVEGISIYGSPYTPTFRNWSFMKDRGETIKKVWEKIPKHLDILVTHGPPHGILDYVPSTKENVGCEELLIEVSNKTPKHHLFGHIHYPGGCMMEHASTKFYNVAMCREDYSLRDEVTVLELSTEMITNDCE